ncbi:MAG TPA: NADH-quinone oxidoreductase subunit L [Candidatus Binatia bacterium]|jgi:NADH-quinone oxidoreductase subunit L|nr:NADH-quinone oxidoreductase subunit L [Candidatus Binatia bacterium]
MNRVIGHLWLIPALPLLAAGLSAVARQRQRRFAASLALLSMAGALVLSCFAFAETLRSSGHGEVSRQIFNFPWFQIGSDWVKLGWVLDPLTAAMLVMVSFVGLLIFIYSVGYMAPDENFTRFFCFLSLFAAAMLGLVIANSLLLFFICWELVGLTSYLLIGFWYHKPSATAAARKAFIVTRIGDLAFLLGIVWLYSQTGTLLFYDGGNGCLEQSALTSLVARGAGVGIAASTGIALLIFCGAIGKSGQVPLHVWLPDAMEGPTPVSALIHAATMVAAGVFLVARVYPLMAAPGVTATSSGALHAVTWVGAITAVFAASIAVAQTDIKRILAYSTVSQLGFMMLGLGAGGVAVGMFHLITHAFFKALLFMGAGSVIHGCHDEQDVRCMGGLRKFMPVTFATYAVGMLALSGFPLLFSGFWSKDDILHAAHAWSVSYWPFCLGVIGAFLTAFYMTRQVCLVFFGNCRLELGKTTSSEQGTVAHAGLPAKEHPQTELPSIPHESPPVMLVPLVVLAFFSIFLGFIGTPAWPWFQAFLNGETASSSIGMLLESDVLRVMSISSTVVLVGLGVGYWLYGRRPIAASEEQDVLQRAWPNLFVLLQRKFFVDEVYEWSLVRFNAGCSRVCDLLDRAVWNGGVLLLAYAVIALSWVNRIIDERVINVGFDESCRGLSKGGGIFSRFQDGQVQRYLRVIGVTLVVLVLLFIWGCHAP